MKTSNNDLNRTQPEEPSLVKMVMFSTGYFLNIFLMVAFNNYVWTFYEGELGLISIVSLWPIYMAIANTLFTIWSMLINQSNIFINYKKRLFNFGFHSLL